jgi:hypothetical protein
MGRVFTTMFDFKGEQHVAMVTVCEESNGQQDFQVQLFNQELFNLIPEGKLTYTSNDNLLPASLKTEAAVELFLSVKSVIHQHLCASPTVEREKTLTGVSNDSNTDTPPQ